MKASPVASSQQPSLHLIGTLLAQLDAGGGVDAVVYAVVERCPAAQCLSVGSIDDGIHLQTGDVALPDGQSFVMNFHHPFVLSLHLQLDILLRQEIVADGFWLPDIHQCPHHPLPLFECRRNLMADMLVSHQIHDEVLQILQSVHCPYFL